MCATFRGLAMQAGRRRAAYDCAVIRPPAVVWCCVAEFPLKCGTNTAKFRVALSLMLTFRGALAADEDLESGPS